MNTQNGDELSARAQENAQSPVSQTGSAGRGRDWNLEENTQRVAVFLKRSLAFGDSDWSAHDLADMLLQELNYRPRDKTEAVAYFRQSQSSAKRAIGGGVEGVHPELALALYYVALTRAWRENGVWISKLPHPEVASGVAHVLRFAWVKDREDLVKRLSELAAATAQ